MTNDLERTARDIADRAAFDRTRRKLEASGQLVVFLTRDEATALLRYVGTRATGIATDLDCAATKLREALGEDDA